MSGYLFEAIIPPVIPDDGKTYMLDVQGRLHMLDLCKATDVSRMEAIASRTPDTRSWIMPFSDEGQSQ